MIRFLLAACLALTAAPAFANIGVTGNAHATWTSPQRVSPSPDAIVRAGHSIAITVTGTVDINQEPKSERKCSLFGLSCKTVNWIEHHELAPNQAPVRVEIRAEGDDAVKQTLVVDAAGGVIQIPAGDNDFRRRYEVLVILEGTGRWIDPARSAGAYTVRLDINAKTRSEKLAEWYTSARPTAEVMTGPDVLDQALLSGHARKVAEVLRTQANARFPLSQVAQRASHERLLRKALEIAPDDPANALALAAYFRGVGQNAQADNILNKVIADLESKTDAPSRRLLGEAFAARADVTLALEGGIGPSAIQTAIAYLSEAIAAFHGANRRDLLAEALVKRARLLRGTRLAVALKDSVRGFEEAYELTPEVARGRYVGASPSGAAVRALDWTEGYQLTLLQGGQPSERVVEDGVAAIWDAAGKRFLEYRNSTTFGWRSLDLETTAPGPLLPNGIMLVSNGAVFGFTEKGSALFTTSSGSSTTVKFGASDACPGGKLGTIPTPPAVKLSLSYQADLVATFCNDIVRLYTVAGGAPTLATEQTVSTSQGFWLPLSLAAGPKNCGAAFSDIDTTGKPRLIIVRPNGSQTPIVLPDPAALAPTAGLTIAPDGKIVVLRQREPIRVYDCKDASLLATIAVPKPSVMSAILGPGVDHVIHWIDGTTFSYADPLEPRIIVVDLKINTAVAYPIPVGMEPDEHFVLSQTLAPAAASGQPPRFVRYSRRTTVRGIGKLADATSATFRLPMVPHIGRITEGGRYLLTDIGNGGGVLVTDLTNGQQAAMSDVLGAVPLREEGRWAAISGAGGFGSSGQVNVYQGASLSATEPLPGLTNEQREVARVAFEAYIASLPPPPAPPNSPPPPPPGIEPFDAAKMLADLKEQAAHPERFYLAHNVGGRLQSLTGGSEIAAHLICSQLLTKTADGKVVPVMPYSSGAIPGILVTYEDGKPVFESIDDAVDCGTLSVVDGASPSLLQSINEPTKRTLRWLRNGAWVTAGEVAPQQSLIVASSLPDGSLLSLISSVPPPAGSPTFALKRFPVTGGMADACATCGALNLEDAEKNLTTASPGTVISNWDGMRLQNKGALASVLVDRTGKLLIAPEDGESIIRSLETGAEVLRVKLAEPLALTRSVAIVGSVDGRLQVHELKSN